MPLFLLRNYAWGNIYAMLFGYRKDGAIENNPSFLVTKKAEKVASDDKDDNEDEGANAEEDAEEDVAADKRVMKQFLHSQNTKNSHDVRAILVKQGTLARQRARRWVVADAGFCLVTACWDLVLAVYLVFACRVRTNLDKKNQTKIKWRITFLLLFTPSSFHT